MLTITGILEAILKIYLRRRKTARFEETGMNFILIYFKNPVYYLYVYKILYTIRYLPLFIYTD